MKRKYVIAGLGLIAALAIASPVVAGTSLKSLVKKEVSKQISKATGPPGANGANGANGTNGADGTARAYATVSTFSCQAAPPDPCDFNHDKGIDSVTRTASGTYCVIASGISGATVTPAVTVDYAETDDPEGNAAAQWNHECSGTGFGVRTERWANPANSTPSDTVAFAIVIP